MFKSLTRWLRRKAKKWLFAETTQMQAINWQKTRKICVGCQHSLPAEAKFCTQCGVIQPGVDVVASQETEKLQTTWHAERVLNPECITGILHQSALPGERPEQTIKRLRKLGVFQYGR